MCGRSSLTKTEKELEARFNANFYSEDLERYNPLPNYNVAPSHITPVITNVDRKHFSAFRWGLIPFWAKDMKIGYKMINARKETVLEKNTFKKAVSSRRCIVPFDGFYEWKKTAHGKEPYRIVTKDQEIFTVAGLWDKWTDDQGEEIYSFTLLTQPPNKTVGEIHDRMPAILTRDQEALWLSDDLSPQQLVDMIEPYPDDQIRAYQVSKAVNNVRNNNPELIKPWESPEPTLFD
ncbi:MAG: SOS response-associated peptidase [Saprospiraceae bacterium]|nr:SOS response-associated peptidase [Saprospiraceae bacterium]